MATRTESLGGTDYEDGEVAKSVDLNDTFSAASGDLGEVRMFALSISGAVTKSSLQAKGWAVCDGTTPASQGISNADITAATPDLRHKFIRMSNDESSGGTGGSDTITLTHAHDIPTSSTGPSGKIMGGNTSSQYYEPNTDTTLSSGSVTFDNQPPYYELVFFIRVRL